MIKLVESKNTFSNLDHCVSSYLDFKPTKKYDISILMGFFDYVEDIDPYFAKLKIDTSKIILGSFPKKNGFLAFQRKIRYNLRNCPLYLYDKTYLEKA